jgi:hypothetical protein
VWTRSAAGDNVLYVDGKAVAHAKDNAGSITNGRPIQIGGESVEKGGQNFTGALTVIAIHTHVISEDRVRLHYDAVKVAPRLPSAVDRNVNFSDEIKPLFNKYCFDCHGPGLDKGGFSMAPGNRRIFLETRGGSANVLKLQVHELRSAWTTK